MRLSEWRKAAPTRDAMNAKVIAVLKPVLSDMGTDADPECWVAWGDDPAFRYSILAPTLAGLVTVAIRISNPEEGPRATAKLIRWSKLSISELGIEAAGGHRLVAVQVESLVLKGMDEEAGLISEFVRGLIASVDNRAPQVIPVAVVQAAGLRAGAAEPIAAVQSTPPAAAAPSTRAIVIAAIPAAERQPAPPTLPRAAAPQFRHQSCSGAIACPQLEQTGPPAGAGASAAPGAAPLALSGGSGSDCFVSAGWPSVIRALTWWILAPRTAPERSWQIALHAQRGGGGPPGTMSRPVGFRASSSSSCQ